MAQVEIAGPPSWLNIERQSSLRGIAEITAHLQLTLGQEMVAFLTGVRSQVMVSRWIHDNVVPSQVRQMRLRYAYRCACILEDAYGTETTRAWFYGTNSYLGDQAPASALRHAANIDDLQPVYEASRIFVGDA